MVSRRTVLTAGALGAGAVALSAGAATKGSPSREHDVIIVGGGFAGLTAARELKRLGQRCLVLEARNRLGGRTFSTSVFGQPEDVGGQWIHWLQPHIWSEVTRYGISLVETPGAATPDSVGVLTDSGLVTQDPAQNFAILQRAMRAVCAESRELFPQPFAPKLDDRCVRLDRLSVQDRLNSLELDPLTRAAITAYITTNVNAAPRDAGLLDQIHWYARAGHDMERLLQACAQFKMREGTVRLINCLRDDAGCEVELSCPVRHIEGSTHEVLAISDDGRKFSAKAMIIALPMNCWADIEWTPGIRPEKLTASRRRHAGSGFELHVLLEGNAGSYMAMAPLPNPINLLYTDKRDARGTVMVGLGTSAVDFDLTDDEAIAREVRRLMPSAKVKAAFAYDWNSDPYSKGTWCNYRPGMWTACGAAMRAPEGRIVFAGSDTADGWRGFIDGAVETGLRAARETATVLGLRLSA